MSYIPRYYLSDVAMKVDCDICGNDLSFRIYTVSSSHGWACSAICFNMWLLRK